MAPCTSFVIPCKYPASSSCWASWFLADFPSLHSCNIQNICLTKQAWSPVQQSRTQIFYNTVFRLNNTWTANAEFSFIVADIVTGKAGETNNNTQYNCLRSKSLTCDISSAESTRYVIRRSQKTGPPESVEFDLLVSLMIAQPRCWKTKRLVEKI